MKKSYTDKFIPSQSVENLDRRNLLKNQKKSFETSNDENAEPVDLVIKYIEDPNLMHSTTMNTVRPKLYKY